MTFPIGRTRQIVVNVPIIDDDINEALEYFLVELTPADPASVPVTVSFERNVMRCDIFDDDGEFQVFIYTAVIKRLFCRYFYWVSISKYNIF